MQSKGTKENFNGECCWNEKRRLELHWVSFPLPLKASTICYLLLCLRVCLWSSAVSAFSLYVHFYLSAKDWKFVKSLNLVSLLDFSVLIVLLCIYNLRCGYMNFASNKQCRQCREQRNKTLAEPGDWECPSCVSVSPSISNLVICYVHIPNLTLLFPWLMLILQMRLR